MAEQQTVSKNQTKLTEPKLYMVIIYNDKITSENFILQILNRVFNKSLDEASSLILNLKEDGKVTGGIYTYDIAITKKGQVDILAIENDFPLRMTVEPVKL